MSSTIDISNVTLLPPSGNETAAWCILAHAWKYLYITRVHGLKAEESLAAAREVEDRGDAAQSADPDVRARDDLEVATEASVRSAIGPEPPRQVHLAQRGDGERAAVLTRAQRMGVDDAA